MSATEAPVARLVPVAFGDVPGWSDDDLAPAFAAFRLSASRILRRAPKTKTLGLVGDALAGPAMIALSLPERPGSDAARRFFEENFAPHAVVPASGEGFVTGYYEPEVDGSLVRSERFPVPIHALPPGLAEIAADADRGDLDPSLTWAVTGPDGRLVEHPDRAGVMAGALDGRGLEIAFVRSWVEAFFIHVQGSARIRLEGGGVRRLTFAGKTGHVYFPIARVLVEKGLMTPPQATADVLRRWLEENPGEAPAVMARNRSYIFFREAPVPDPALGPVAAADVPLIPGRSLAVDRNLMTFHMPVFVAADLGDLGPFQHLMIAQDTGSAILGPARGDIFFGTGEEAWRSAARVRHAARFFVLVPAGGLHGP